MKVLWFIKGLGLGGAERMLVDAVPYHDRGRFGIEVAYLLPWKGFLEEEFRRVGVRVTCLDVKSNLGMPRAVPALRRLIRDRGIGVMHAHLPMAGLVARLAARDTGIPVVYTEHNLQERYHPLMRVANRLTFGMNARVIAVSEDVARSLRRHGLDRKAPIDVMPNRVPVGKVRQEGGAGAEVRRELGIPADAPVVGSVAVFRVQKRLKDWLAVARRVCAVDRGVRFLLGGDGPEMPMIRHEVVRLGLESRVLLPGFRPDGRAVIGAMDVFLMTSEFEGLPIALLEALALGKPVVATAVGGIPEAVTDGRDGFLLPFGEIDSIARRVRELVENRELRGRMGMAAAETAEKRFDLPDNIRRIEEIYAEVSGAVRG